MPNQRRDAAYVALIQAIRARVEQFAQARFAAGQFRDADLARFVAQVVPVVLAGRRQVSALTDVYLAQTLTTTLGRKVPPLGPIDTNALRGVDPAEVYARPFVTVRTELSKGATFDDSVKAGAERLSDLVLTDMQLAKTNTAQNVFSKTDGVAGYKRTLTGSKNCALCSIASTMRYHKADLMPIHPGCDCGVAPIVAGDRARMDTQLELTHAAVAERFGKSDPGGRAMDYRKFLLVHEHGELGPVLTIKGQKFTGPTDLPRI
jgi:hypothetical protein